MKNHLKWFKKYMTQRTTMVVLGLIIVGLGLGFATKRTLIADNGDSAAKGALFGGLTGAALGGAIGGGKGAGIGLGAGLVGGALIGGAAGSSRSRDPYRQLEKEQNKLYKLQSRYDNAKSEAKRMNLQRQIETQMMRVQDLQNRLGVRPTTTGQPQYRPVAGQQMGYQAAGYR